MPNTSDYQSIAPVVMTIGDLDATTLESKFAVMPEAPIAVTVPDLTQQQVSDLIDDLTASHSIQESLKNENGIAGLAAKRNIPLEHVKTVCVQLEMAHSLYLNSL